MTSVEEFLAHTIQLETEAALRFASALRPSGCSSGPEPR